MRHPYLVRDSQPNGKGSKGNCTHCGQPATKEALFKSKGAIVVEKYCDGCLEPRKFGVLMSDYSRSS